MSITEKIKKFGQYIALAIAGLGISVALPAKAVTPEPLAQVLKLNSQELDSYKPNFKLNVTLEDKVQDKELSNIPIQDELIDLEEHSKLFDNYTRKPFDSSKWFLELPAYSLAGLVGTIFWHELGHARTAFYLGCKDIELRGPDIEVRSSNHSFNYPYVSTWGSVTYNPLSHRDLTPHERNIISAAGVEATTAGAHFLYQALKTDQIPESIEPFVATTSLIMMADRHRYLWSAALQNYLRMNINPSNDFHNIMKGSFRYHLEGYYQGADSYFLDNGVKQRVQKGDILRKDENGNFYKFRPYADKEGNFRKMIDKHSYWNVNGVNSETQKRIDIAYGVALAASIVELGLRFNEIKYLVGTAVGDNPKAPEGMEVLKAGFYPIQDGFFVSIDGTF